jgi:hypothetical protein
VLVEGSDRKPFTRKDFRQDYALGWSAGTFALCLGFLPWVIVHAAALGAGGSLVLGLMHLAAALSVWTICVALIGLVVAFVVPDATRLWAHEVRLSIGFAAASVALSMWLAAGVTAWGDLEACFVGYATGVSAVILSMVSALRRREG